MLRYFFENVFAVREFLLVQKLCRFAQPPIKNEMVCHLESPFTAQVTEGKTKRAA